MNQCSLSLVFPFVPGSSDLQPIDRFGGAAVLDVTRERGVRKLLLAEQSGVTLIEWPYTRQVTKEAVADIIFELNSNNKYLQQAHASRRL